MMGTGNPTGRRQFKGRCWAQAFPGAVVRPTRAHLGSPGCVGTCGGHCSSPQPGGPRRGSTGDPHLPHSSKPPGFPLKPAHLDAFLSMTSPLLHLLFLPRRLRGEVCFPNRTCHQQDSEWASQNPPASAGDMDSSPGPRRSTCLKATRLRTTTEPPSPPRAGARPQGRSSHSLQLEKAHVQQRGPQIN